MRRVQLAAAAAVMTLLMSAQAYAAGWVQDQGRPASENGISNWWYQNDDGTYPADGWFWLDGNRDGVAESYRFNENGWLYISTSVDGYDVNNDGAWVSGGQVVGKNIETGWKKISGKWYYYDNNGSELKGYHEVDGLGYYFHDNGQMATQTVHAVNEGVYYVVDKDDHYIIDIVDDDDWYAYRNSMDSSSYTPPQNTGSSGGKTSASSSQTNQGTISNGNKSTLSDDQAYEKIIALKGSYPEGMKWTNSNSYSSSGRVGLGCAGFAFMVQDTVFGKGAPKTVYDQLVWEDLRVGDHLRVKNGGHSVIVLGIGDDTITLCEGNFNSSIHWGRTMTREQLENEFDYRETCY